MKITEENLLYKLGMGFSGTEIPQPVDLRGKLATNPIGKRWGSREVNKLEGLVIHQALGDGSIEGLAKYHTSTKSHLYAGGVESLAYTIAIRKNGQIGLCNDLSKATWSQGFRGIDGDENRKYISVLVEGYLNYNGCENSGAGEPTEEQLISLLMLWGYCKRLWHWDGDAIYGHYFFGKSSCPGNTIKSLIEAIRS